MNDPVALSLLTLVPGISGGSETYARELCAALARQHRFRYAAYVPTIATDAGAGLPTEVVHEYRASREMAGRLASMTRAAVFPSRLRRRLLDKHPAIVHFLMTVMLPPMKHPRLVSTIHDVQHEVFPQFFSRAELAYRRAVYGWSVRRSRVVITGSDHARATLLERFGLAPERVRRIHYGVDHDTFRPGGENRERFVLYPASRWAHKNHATLFDALAIMRRTEPDLRLVLTGSGHEGQPAPDGVEVLGRVTRERLATLYRTAGAVVFPSLYEGFGFPVLEAMASGCPVACSNVASLPEVAGDVAIMFDPHDARAIADAALRAVHSGADIATRGIAWASRFSWAAAAEAHEDLYAELLGDLA